MSDKLAPLHKALKAISQEESLDNPSLIGAILRDQYGIPSVRRVFGIKLSEVLPGRQALYEKRRLMTRLRALQDHCQAHHKDYPAARSIHRLKASLSHYEQKDKYDQRKKLERA